MMRLQELGLITGTTRAKIEEMQKTGVSFAKIWKLASGSEGLGRFSGSMKKAESTLKSVRSSFIDGLNMVKINLFEGLLKYLSASGKQITESLGKLADSVKRFEWSNIGDKIVKGASTLSKLIEELASGDFKFVKDMTEWGLSLPRQLGRLGATLIADLIKNLAPIFNRFAELIVGVFKGLHLQIGAGIWDGLTGFFKGGDKPDIEGESKKNQDALDVLAGAFTAPIDFSKTMGVVADIAKSNPLAKRLNRASGFDEAGFNSGMAEQEALAYQAEQAEERQRKLKLYNKERENLAFQKDFMRKTSSYRNLAGLESSVRNSTGAGREYAQRELDAARKNNEQVQQRMALAFEEQTKQLRMLYTELTSMNTALVGGR
jgi:hypothetical protein